MQGFYGVNVYSSMIELGSMNECVCVRVCVVIDDCFLESVCGVDVGGRVIVTTTSIFYAAGSK